MIDTSVTMEGGMLLENRHYSCDEEERYRIVDTASGWIKGLDMQNHYELSDDDYRKEYTILALPGDWHQEESVFIDGVKWVRHNQHTSKYLWKPVDVLEEGPYTSANGNAIFYTDAEFASMFPTLSKNVVKKVVIDKPYVAPKPKLKETISLCSVSSSRSVYRKDITFISYGEFSTTDIENLEGSGELELVLRRKSK